MFSQQKIKRRNLTNNHPQFQNGFNQGVVQGLHPNYQQYSEFQMPYQNFNDNFSLYSSNSTGPSISNYNNMKKNFIPEDSSAVLSKCIEEILPKMASDCAEVVFSQICSELDRQADEIMELKSQMEKFKSMPISQLENKLTNSSSTPMKKMTNINRNLNIVKSNLSNQNEIQKGNLSDNSVSISNFYDSLQEKIRNLQENIEEERKAAERMNYNLKDMYVDMVGMRNFVEERVGYLMNDIKPNSQIEINSNYSDIICEINDTLEDINNMKKGNRMANVYKDASVMEKASEQNLMFPSREFNQSYQSVNVPVASNNVTTCSNNSHNSSNAGPFTLPQKNKKASKFSSFGNLAFN